MRLPTHLSANRFTPYALLAMPVVLMLLVIIWPVVSVVWMSLWDTRQSLTAPVWAGLSQYGELLTSYTFWQALGNTACLVAILVPSMLVCSVSIGLALHQPAWGLKLFRVLLYLPVITSMVVVGFVWKWLYLYDGLLNTLLAELSIAPLGWLTDPKFALMAVALVVVWKGASYYGLMVLAQRQSAREDLYEAAAMDGASLWQGFRWITLPHLSPTLKLVALMAAMGSLKLFTEVYVLTRGGPLGSTRSLVYWLYELGFEQLDLGKACAVAVVLLVLVLGVARLLGGARQETSL